MSVSHYSQALQRRHGMRLAISVAQPAASSSLWETGKPFPVDPRNLL
jgi:hypothetical protein